jgi:DNA-binding Lrp family transcriptional regulator
MSRFAKLVNAQFQKKQEEQSSLIPTDNPPDISQLPDSSQLPYISQPQEVRQPPQSSQPPDSSQLPEQAGGRHQSSQLLDSSQPPDSSQLSADRQITVDLISSLPDVAGRLELPNQLVDHLLRLLDPYEQAVYLQLYRLSWGFNKPTCSISNPKLAERAGMPESTVKKTLGKLKAKGLIKKTGLQIGYGKEQGIDFWVAAPSSQLQRSRQIQESRQPPQAHIKINTQKENTQTQEPPAAAVRVGSKFSLEECRKYAKHLQSTGQGINNPGGYATTIHRTGEADMLIESFLHPETYSNPDTSQCPDCQGTGFYYPQGTEGGVARCKHEKLKEGN